jgi:hypothetical protein
LICKSRIWLSLLYVTKPSRIDSVTLYFSDSICDVYYIQDYSDLMDFNHFSHARSKVDYIEGVRTPKVNIGVSTIE